MRNHNPFKSFFFVVAAVIVVGYSLFTARFFIAGPQIVLDNPEYIETTEPLITISGISSNIQALWVNGHEVFLEEGGAYSDTRILTPGISYITLLAKDRFDRVEERIITAYYTPPYEFPSLDEIAGANASNTDENTDGDDVADSDTSDTSDTENPEVATNTAEEVDAANTL